MKDDYTLKEILLGLRSEQMKVAERLKQLKTNLVKNPSTEKSFFVASPSDDAIIYYYMFKTNLLKWDSISFELKKRLDGNFSNFYLPVEREKQSKFNMMCEDLLDDEFVKNSDIIVETKYGELRINPSHIHYFTNDSKVSRINNFTYYAKNDSIFVHGENFIKDKRKIVIDLLNASIPKEKISDYLQNVIDLSLETKKDILIPDIKVLGQNMQFYLNQERENYVLVKKKK